ncbi:hypothetical protein IMY05_007G0085700 [Salix suchowensis]|nr:hypothetical protein IMY05_007G0085700 [Salix suchowensis]
MNTVRQHEATRVCCALKNPPANSWFRLSQQRLYIYKKTLHLYFFKISFLRSQETWYSLSQIEIKITIDLRYPFLGVLTSPPHLITRKLEEVKIRLVRIAILN